MPRGKADISNTAIRIFLQNVGELYDGLREYTPYKGTLVQKQEILSFFDSRCCYCGTELTAQTLTQDHLIPMNKESLGLNAWGNVVPSCRDCNRLKHHRGWETHLAYCCAGHPKVEASRKSQLTRFMRHYRYNPSLQLASVAGNLYQDVGEVAMTLINLRFKQAEELLRGLHLDAVLEDESDQTASNSEST